MILEDTRPVKVISTVNWTCKSIEKITKKYLERRIKMATKIARLTTGEEIISDFSENGDTVSFKNPAMLIPAGNGQLAFLPWMMYAELENNTVTISSEHVMFVAPPKKELMNEYNKTIGSGLVVPETKPELSLTT